MGQRTLGRLPDQGWELQNTTAGAGAPASGDNSGKAWRGQKNRAWDVGMRMRWGAMGSAGQSHY